MDQFQSDRSDDRMESSFYAIIPDIVMADPALPDSAKLLFGTITSLQKACGYCYATNKYLAAKVGKEPDTISRLVKKLSDAGYLEMELIRDPSGKEILERRIYPVMAVPGIIQGYRKKLEQPPVEKSNTPPVEKSNTPPVEKSNTPPVEKSKEKREESRYAVDTPLKSPRGAGCSRRREAKEAPDHMPERWERFWAAYPRGENKQRAIKAWDQLKPNDALCDAMAKALKRQLKSDDWQKGIGIPHAATWINQRRWEDEVKASVQVAHSMSGGLEQW